MWFKKNNNKNSEKKYEKINVTIEEVKKAIRKFSDEAPKGVYTSVLVNDDHSIDFKLLLSYLNGYPDRAFYMSKETYEVFEEEEKEIPYFIDKIQWAVDQFVEMEKQLPIIDDDPYKKVSYLKLENRGLLKERPPIDFYITEQEDLITHIKPS